MQAYSQQDWPAPLLMSVADDFAEALVDQLGSYAAKNVINALTMLAQEHLDAAAPIAAAIIRHIRAVRP